MMKLFSNKFGEKLRQSRIEKGYNLEDFASLIRIPKADLWAMENRGLAPVDLSILSKLATILDVSLYWLIQDHYEKAPNHLILKSPTYLCVWCGCSTADLKHVCPSTDKQKNAVVK